MSGESATHVALVARLIEHVKQSHSPQGGLLIFADHHSNGRNLPHRIGGFLPDVFASDLPATFEVVGEAKTIADLKSPRSQRQIVAFLDHLAVRVNSTFYLYVPPFARVQAKSIIRPLIRPEHERTTIEVLDGT